MTILQCSGRLVPDHEPEAGTAIAQYLQEKGAQVVTGVTVHRPAVEGATRVVHARVAAEKRQFRADQVLLVLGRQPNPDGLGLAHVEVELTGGAVVIDEFLQTTNPAVYAVDDVTELPENVYVAASAGTLAAHNAFSDQPKPLDLSALPGVIFTEPQIATVGLTEAQATAPGNRVRTATIGMEHVARAQWCTTCAGWSSWSPTATPAGCSAPTWSPVRPGK